MAAAVTLLAKQRGGPSLAHQLLFYPVTDASMDDESYNRFQSGPWLTRPAMQWFFDAYAPNATERSNPLISPLLAPEESLRGLPPATVITAENDVLRDEGEAYGRRLTRAGVSVKSVRYNGTIHDFVMLNALATTPAAQSATALGSEELRAALRR
jgi:acetyl esterase